jgi:hypothetical protein
MLLQKRFKPQKHSLLIRHGLLLLKLGKHYLKETSDSILVHKLTNRAFDHGAIFLRHNPVKLICVVRLQGLLEHIS